ncbi:cellulase family glycosylhydrolase [Microbulbifer sp. CAU 1566]|uniref:carbohydrate-binding protein n=1 Tax=Microbulbifer sp. CAU 1566 TaxID=2933269 RepID=UPI002005CF55|nr:carbohydrate-binding protein [Microbulbifer sp. CAU 1566]MCK7597639.1 cellulase family glycosylhydrolase [Microbulbifer sp. CAU 1566]
MRVHSPAAPLARAHRLLLPILAAVFTTLLLTACGSSDSDTSTPEPEPLPEPQPEPQPQPEPEPPSFTRLQTEGTRWINADGEQVLLKGVNLGNWLLQEFWMMGQSSEAVNDQCTLEGIFDSRFGFAERERLMDLFRDNWIGERDWDLIESFGFNVVRLPFIWNLIEDEQNPMHLRDDAWQYLDSAIAQAEARGIYVILDLHGAVGAQGWEHHSGCAGKNLYWDTPEYQARTEWLWQQVASRYADRPAVAGYGVLNEPWGTTPDNLAMEAGELYDAIREVDGTTIVILPGHSAGLDAYPKPADAGQTNVAFEMHFYPGIFGWGEIGYPVNRDWLTCGEDGSGGVCAWDEKLRQLDAPFLIGEFQPWTGLGPELGAQITRATYDTYASFGWASTAWSYKLITHQGGEGNGTWGLVTNEQGLGLLAKADTWACPGWDSALESACGSARSNFTPDRAGAQTYFLVVKFGSCCDGALDASIDSLSIVDTETGNELLANGGFGSESGWTSWYQSAPPTLNFNATDAALTPTGSDGPVLHMSGAADVNGGIYQPVTLESGRNYQFSGVFRDNGSTNAWAEIYLVASQPVDGTDVLAEGPFASLDFNSAPKEEIEALFRAFGSVPYDIHETAREALTAETGPDLFDLPAAPTQLVLAETTAGTELSWSASDTADIDGYNIYRSTTSGSGYTQIAGPVAGTTYTDESAAVTYYYRVTAVRGYAESYPGNEVATAVVAQNLPGRIEAETFSAMSGIQLENCTDNGGGLNVAWLDPGDWLEYRVSSPTASTYTIHYRLASGGGSNGFSLSVDGGDIAHAVAVPDTGDWQAWTTVEATVELPAGESVLRLDATDGGWNLNWLEAAKVP